MDLNGWITILLSALFLALRLRFFATTAAQKMGAHFVILAELLKS